ncbi:hypothetical protein C0J52_26625 [Blattella germanica]|nr:hypothetical protein C0J52_26625 [Blattella germanica]
MFGNPVKVIQPEPRPRRFGNRDVVGTQPYEIGIVICDAIMRIRSIVARWPGSTYDSRIFRNSTIRDRLESGEVTGHLLGDSGYPCMKYLLRLHQFSTQGMQLRDDITERTS